MARIYLDNNATTSHDPRVLKAMMAEYSGPPGNPSSIHYFGKQAKALLTAARQKIAGFFGAKPEELIFTSGGTESLNLIIRGIFGGRPKGHLITTGIEHSAVYRTVQALEGAGLSVTLFARRWLGGSVARAHRRGHFRKHECDRPLGCQ